MFPASWCPYPCLFFFPGFLFVFVNNEEALLVDWVRCSSNPEYAWSQTESWKKWMWWKETSRVEQNSSVVLVMPGSLSSCFTKGRKLPSRAFDLFGFVTEFCFWYSSADFVLSLLTGTFYGFNIIHFGVCVCVCVCVWQGGENTHDDRSPGHPKSQGWVCWRISGSGEAGHYHLNSEYTSVKREGFAHFFIFSFSTPLARWFNLQIVGKNLTGLFPLMSCHLCAWIISLDELLPLWYIFIKLWDVILYCLRRNDM